MVDVLLEELDQNLASGVSIAVMERGVITWAEGFGSASPNGDQPIGPDTMFQIGSTTKQLTAMAVLMQVDRGLYALDDTVADLLPEFSLASDPDWAGRATVRDLLSHQGGVTDHVELVGTADDERLADFYYHDFANTMWAMNPPGLFWNYSNPNFDLAGLIAEVHDPAGRRYPDLIVEDLFEPIGMTRSFARKAEAMAAGDYTESVGAHPESVHFGTFPDATFGEPIHLTIDDLQDVASQRPSGGTTFSTPSDMCRWGGFLIHGDPSMLSDSTRAALTTAEAPTQWNDAVQYGLGEFVWDQFPLSGDLFSGSEYYPIRSGSTGATPCRSPRR